MKTNVPYQPVVQVFKTNIRYKNDLKKISPFMVQETRIKKWTVDRKDIDHVLRIEAEQLQATEIVLLLQKAGFFCEELPD